MACTEGVHLQLDRYSGSGRTALSRQWTAIESHAGKCRYGILQLFSGTEQFAAEKLNLLQRKNHMAYRWSTKSLFKFSSKSFLFSFF